MNRRGFLGFFGGAVTVGPAVVKAAADDAMLLDAGFPSGGYPGVAPCDPMPPMAKSTEARIIKWIRKAGIPDWKMQLIREAANRDRGYGLDPDIACLRAVSAGWKAREQRRRNVNRAIERSLASINYHGQRESFMDKIRSKFGRSVDWYD